MKLILTLCSIVFATTCFATFLPNGNYSGSLNTDKGTVDAIDPSKSTVLNDQANVVIPTLHDINAQDGLLTGSVVNMGQGQDIDCLGGSAQFVAKKFGIPIRASNVKITNCEFQNNTFTGRYSAVVPLLGVQSGSFTFTLQQ